MILGDMDPHAITSGQLKPLEALRGLEPRRAAVQLALYCQNLTNRFPIDEQFNLTQQIRRSAVSVASNITEGFGRRSARGFAHYLTVAYGSLLELDTQLEIAHGVGYLENEDLPDVVALIGRTAAMIDALIRSLDESD